MFLAFRSPVPGDVRDDHRLHDPDVEFREETRFHEAELVEQVVGVHYTMLDLGFIEVGTGPETDRGEGCVDAARRPADRGKTDAEITATFLANLRAGNVVFGFHPEGTVLGGDD